jgi:hypothetical protein
VAIGAFVGYHVQQFADKRATFAAEVAGLQEKRYKQQTEA